MSQIIEKIKNAVKIKSGESTSSKQVQSWTVRDSRPCRNRMTNNYATGTFTGLIIFSAALTAPLLCTPDTHATTASINVTLPTEISLNLNARSSSGTFATSDTSTTTFGIKTDNYTGYTLRIAAKTADDNALINSTDSTKTIPSLTIANGVSESNYKDDTYASNNNLNNTWGYRPSKYNSSDNSNYLPAPASTIPAVLDATTVANNTTANNYNIAIGARIDNTITSGAYGNTFVLTVVANDPKYSIAYDKNTTDNVTNMPDNISTTTITSGTVTISSNEPSRDGYTFGGWCTSNAATAVDETTCTAASGTYYAKGATYTIDQVGSNALELYAMWADNSSGGGGEALCSATIPNVSLTYMQDITSSNKATVMNNMVQNTQYALKDKRDGKTYCIAKLADNKVWMVQNLAIEPGTAMTKDDTNIASTYTASNPYTLLGDKYDLYFDGQSSGTAVDDKTSSGYCYTTNGRTNACTHVATDKDVSDVKAADSSLEYTTTQLGAWYNYAAATAKTITGSSNRDPAVYDICPKGWRLPNDSGNTTGGEIYDLMTALNKDSTALAAFNPLYGGSYLNGNRNYAGAGGYWWSSTTNATANRYSLCYSGGILYTVSGNRQYGYYVRCTLAS